METLDARVVDYVRTCINLQLAGAAINQSGMLSIKQLYSNLQRFVDDLDLSYAEFIDILDSSREELNIRKEGEIGHDVNYISMKRS